MNSFERFNETKLPDSQLKDELIFDKDYEYATEVWNELEMKNMGDYLVLKGTEAATQRFSAANL